MLTSNDSLKFNFKLGGRNHSIGNIPGLRQGTIIMGADVTHSGKGIHDNGAPSLAGVVATVGNNTSNYLASARLQDHNTEVSLEYLKLSLIC